MNEKYLETLPRPRLILRVGGLGNRNFGSDNGIDEHPARLIELAEKQCDKVFEELEKALSTMHLEDQMTSNLFPRDTRSFARRLYEATLGLVFGRCDRWNRSKLAGSSRSVFSAERPKITILSGTAKGGDEMIRRHAVRTGAPVDYEHLPIEVTRPSSLPGGLGIGSTPDKLECSQTGNLDRATAKQVANIARDRAFGYRAQSEALRHHSDVLLAIWDPDAEGKAGGTSESVLEALRERIPVIAIRIVGESDDPTIQVLQNPEELLGRVVTKTTIEDLVRSRLAFPDAETPHGNQRPTSREMFVAFLKFRPWKRSWPGRVWQAFDSFIKNLPDQTDDDSATRKDRFQRSWKSCFGIVKLGLATLWAIFPRIPLSRQRPSRVDSADEGSFAFHYGRVKDCAASHGAGVFGDLHRGGVVASYVLAACAVSFAIIGGLLHFYEAPSITIFVAAALEVIAIFLMFALATVSRNERWNTAYTDSRILSEALRMMEFLGPLGVHTPLPKLPPHLALRHADAGLSDIWSMWYFRALVRMAPLRLGDRMKVDICAIKDSILEEWLKKQAEHHKSNVTKQRNLFHGAERFSFALFMIVFVAAFAHLLEIIAHGHVLFAVCMLICIVIPAALAAMHGLLSQLDASALEQRSSSMHNILTERSNVIRRIDTKYDPYSANTVWTLTSEALVTASLMMDETAGWSLIYKNTDIHAG